MAETPENAVCPACESEDSEADVLVEMARAFFARFGQAQPGALTHLMEETNHRVSEIFVAIQAARETPWTLDEAIANLPPPSVPGREALAPGGDFAQAETRAMAHLEALAEELENPAFLILEDGGNLRSASGEEYTAELERLHQEGQMDQRSRLKALNFAFQYGARGMRLQEFVERWQGERWRRNTELEPGHALYDRQGRGYLFDPHVSGCLVYHPPPQGLTRAWVLGGERRERVITLLRRALAPPSKILGEVDLEKRLQATAAAYRTVIERVLEELSAEEE